MKEHAKKLNKMVSESELRPPMPSTPSNGSGLNPLKDETDALLGASEPLKRRWMVKSSSCDYNEMLQMLRDCPKLAGFKDYTSVTFIVFHDVLIFRMVPLTSTISLTLFHFFSFHFQNRGYAISFSQLFFQYSKKVINFLMIVFFLF